MTLEIHPEGFLSIGTESGEINIWDRIQSLDHKHRHSQIILNEHIKNCHLTKWNHDGTKLITGNF